MSVIRRLYNVAYGKVRLWQTGEDERPEPELEPRGERLPLPPSAESLSAELEPEGEPIPAEPRPRRL